ncbi:MAG: glycosyltransferase family 2 protein [Lachnospiraceae bacterium]|uniref:tetratricopeptide repeat-containing glycosyltransferase family 2 protein n=1 Tax=Candidatus Merdisoma sp. JLR.KK011 TaxID=3114299 RepID=UPI002FF31B5F|nr:glycosyltransferase family 2 protein [Lachnospiraceae bacterium]
MPTISLCMIVKNEEMNLARCLDSVADLVEEIIIVDTGSKDRTVEIASHYTTKVYLHPWKDDFSDARNYSFSKAAMDYCMWMDADDILEEGEKDKFLKLKQSLTPDIDMVMMKYHTAFDEAGKPSFSYFRERWIRNCGLYRWIGAVHEVIPPKGRILYSDLGICHKKTGPGSPDRNLKIYQKLLAEGKQLEPRQQYYYGRELYYHEEYKEAVCVFEQFLLSEEGWIENKIEACAICARCYEKLGQEQAALLTLLRSMSFDLPRAELCCEIGKYFLEHESFYHAIYWYETALKIPKNEYSGGFILSDCYDYIPLLQLCVCYDKLGDRQKAKEYNERAGVCKPYSKAYLYNKQYFEGI